MPPKESKEGTELSTQMTLAELQALRQKTSGFEKSKKSFAGLPDLNRQLDDLIHSNKNISDEERKKAALDILSLAYVDLYLDERTKGMLGSTEKGENLKYMEELWEKTGFIAKAGSKAEVPILQVISASASSSRLVVDHLFSRAMTEGFGDNNENSFKNACKLVVRMGVKAIEDWNNHVDKTLTVVSPEVKEKLKISTNVDEQDEKHFAEVYHTVSEKKHAAKAIAHVFGLELLLHLAREAAAKINASLQGLKSIDKKDVEKRITLINGANEFERLIKNLKQLQQKKNNLHQESEIYEEIMKTYSYFYTHDQGKGWGGKGQLLKDMEAILDQFYKKTENALFIGESKKENEAIISSVVSDHVSTVTRQNMVKDLFNRIMKVISDPNFNKEKDRSLYFNTIKAILIMGPQAIEAWNERALHADPERLLRYPDLLINAVNTKDEDIMAAYNALTAEPVEAILEEKEEAEESKSGSYTTKEFTAEPIFHEEETSESESKSISSPKRSRSSSGHEGDEATQKKLRAYQSSLDEFRINQINFHRNMKIFNQLLDRAIEDLREISPEHASWLAFYAEPYRSLIHNPFSEDKSEDLEQKINLIQDGMAKFNAKDEVIGWKQPFKQTVEASKRATFNKASFVSFMEECESLPKVKKLPEIKETNDGTKYNNLKDFLKTERNVGHNAKPFQNLTRYKMTLEEIKKYASDPDDVDRFQALVNKVHEETGSINSAIAAAEGEDCYLILSKENLEVKPEDFIARAADQFNLDKSADKKIAAGKIKAAFVVSQLDDKRVIRYINLSKNPQEQFQTSSRAVEDIRLYDDTFGGPEKLSKSAAFIKKLSNSELEAIFKVAGHKHLTTGGQEAVIQSRFYDFLSGGISLAQVTKMKKALDDHLKQNPIESLQQVSHELEQLNPQLSDTERMEQVRNILMQPYADLYVNERSKDLLGTSKGKNLEFLEKIMEENNIMNLSPLAKDAHLKKDTVDARILSGFQNSPEHCKEVAQHLLRRAMIEGVNGGHESVFVNARKAIGRMGQDAINAWNEMVLDLFQSNIHLIVRSGSMEDEKNIVAAYKEVSKNAKIKDVVMSSYYLDVLIDLFKKEPNAELIVPTLKILRERQENGRDVRPEVHALLMRHYIKAHCFDIAMATMDTERRPFTLDKMMQLLSQFHQKTKSTLFGAIDEGLKNQVHTDKLILATVTRVETKRLVEQLFEHAMRAGFSGANQARQKQVYVRDVMTVVDMGPLAIRTWNELAAEQYKDSPQLLANAVIQASGQKPEAIGELHGVLMNVPQMKQVVKSHELDSTQLNTPSSSYKG